MSQYVNAIQVSKSGRLGRWRTADWTTHGRMELLFKRVLIGDGCWECSGHLDKNGYATCHVKIDGSIKTVRAHRLVYETLRGKIPDGLVLDHLCRNPKCVNPDHLEAVTGRENSLRGVGPAAKNAAKTHCKNGHELVGENVYVYNNGRARHCRVCVKARSSADYYSGKKKDKPKGWKPK